MKQAGIRNTFQILLFLLACLYVCHPTLASDRYHWSEIRLPNSEQPEDKHNTLIEGAFQFNWLLSQLTQRLSVHFQSNFDYSLDTKQYAYNNKFKPELELRLKYESPYLRLEPGLRLLNEYRSVTDHGETQWQAFLYWFKYWRVLGKKDERFSFAGSLWGEVRNPSGITPLERENALLETQFEQGVSRYQCSGGASLDHYVRVKLVTDTEGLPWNNKVTTSIGTRCSFPIKQSQQLQIGVQYNFDHRWKSLNEKNQQDLIMLINWSHW